MLDFMVWLQQFRSPVLDFIVEAITITGEENVLLVGICLIYWSINKKLGYIVGLAVVMSSCFNAALKEILQVARPWTLDDRIIPIRQETATGYSFPSGHTQNSGAFWFSIAIYVKRKSFTIIALVMMVLVAISRVYLSVHTPLDVAAGLLFAVGFAFLSYHLINKLQEKGISWYFTFVWIVLIGLMFFIRTETYFKMAGVTLAIIPSYILEQKYIRFDVRGKLFKQIIKVLIGLVIALGIRLGLSAIFPEMLIFDFIRYFFMGLGILILAPWIFVKLKLSEKIKA